MKVREQVENNDEVVL